MTGKKEITKTYNYATWQTRAISPETVKAMKAAAKTQNMPMGAWANMVLREAANAVLGGDCPPPVDRLPVIEIRKTLDRLNKQMAKLG